MALHIGHHSDNFFLMFLNFVFHHHLTATGNVQAEIPGITSADLRPWSAVAVVSEWSITDFILVDFDKFGNLLRTS